MRQMISKHGEAAVLLRQKDKCVCTVTGGDRRKKKPRFDCGLGKKRLKESG